MAAELATFHENDMNKYTSHHPAVLVLVGMVPLLLSACGGGGGGSTASATPTPAATVSSMASLVAADGFSFSTAQKPPSGITLARASKAILGNGVKLLVTGFTCAHEVVGALVNPMATDSYTTYPLTTAEAGLTSLTVSFGAFQIPAAVTEVLVTVVDGNSTLYSKRHSVTSLASLNLAFPDEPPSLEQTTFLDLCN